MMQTTTTPQVPSGYNPVLPDDLVFEEMAERALRDAISSAFEPTVCPRCDAVYMDGRWRWGPLPVQAQQALCPACKREEEQNPAGFVLLSGPFFREHRQEVTSKVHEQAERKRHENPLMRIMGEEVSGEDLLLTTTDVRLAHLIGAALHHAYDGRLDYHQNPEQDLLRVHWSS